MISYIYHSQFEDNGIMEELISSLPKALDAKFHTIGTSDAKEAHKYRDINELNLFMALNYCKYKKNQDLENKIWDTRIYDITNTITSYNIPLLKYTASTFADGKASTSCHLSVDNFVGIGKMVLLRSIELFDFNTGLKFSTYFVTGMHNRFKSHFDEIVEMNMHLSNMREEFERVGDLSFLSQNIGCEVEVEDGRFVEQDPLDTMIQREERERNISIINDFHETMSSREKTIFEYRVMAKEPMSLKELGTAMGLSYARISQLETGLKDKLKKFHKKHELSVVQN